MTAEKTTSDGETLCTGCWDKSGHDINAETDLPAGEPIYWERASYETDEWNAYFARCVTERSEKPGFPVMPMMPDLDFGEWDPDWSEDEPIDGPEPGEECGRWDNGRLMRHCTKAGSEECEFECPYRR